MAIPNTAPGADHVFGGMARDDYDDPVYVISVAAELAEMHPQTLRTYEREDLIMPARTAGNTRRYSSRDIDRLRFIRYLTQEEGLNLAGVRVVLGMGEQLERAKSRVVELEDMVRRLADRLKTDVREAHESHEAPLVKAPTRDVEIHATRSRRRTSGPVQRAKVVRPPTADVELLPVSG